MANTPTDELLADYQGGNANRYLENLLFQYGRYMLISSSRDSLPANLQGVWNNNNQINWASDYHFNVNLQMNYWPAFVTNIAKTADPLVEYLDALRSGPAALTAREHFGVENGWVVNTVATPLGMVGAGWDDFSWSWAPGSAAWICNNLWDYYQFTQDPEVLDRIYPIMKDAALFWTEYLIEVPIDPQNPNGPKELVSAPSGSSEHGTVGVGTTYDMSLSKMLLLDVITAANIKGVDADLVKELQGMVDMIHPFYVGESGQLKEWREETTYSSIPGTDPGHRHMSHLLALHPGNLITEETPELMAAATRALELRGDGSGAGTGGWSMAQKSNMWARTGNGDKALYYLQLLFNGGIYPNLFDYVSGGVFQVDGNFGATSAMAEMLIQSHAGYIKPLAALPSDWRDGSYNGLMARGNFETDAVWADNNLTSFVLRSGSGGACKVRYKDIAKATLTQGGAPVTFTVIDSNTVEFDTEPGQKFTFSNIPGMLAAPDQIKAVRPSNDKVNLTWEAVERASAYSVYRADSTDNVFVRIAAAVTESAYTDQTALALNANEQYTYKIAAVDANGVIGRLSTAVRETAAPGATVDAETVNEDSERLIYEGSWDGTGEKYSNQVGATCSLTFEGSGIEFYTTKQHNTDFANVYLDKGTPNQLQSLNIPLKASPLASTCIFRITGLSAGEHTITVEKAEGKDFIIIDYFCILKDPDEVTVQKIDVASLSGVMLLSGADQTLQMVAEVSPANAPVHDVAWSLQGATNLASIDQNGLLTATGTGTGTVTVVATSQDASGARGSMSVKIDTKGAEAGAPTNVLLNKEAEITLGERYNSTAYGPEFLTDGYRGGRDNAGNRLSLALEAEAHIDIALEETFVIDQAIVCEQIATWWDPQDGSRIDSVSVQIPGETPEDDWIPLATTTESAPDEAGDIQTFELQFDAVETDTLRFVFKDEEAAGMTMWELEAFGVPAAPVEKVDKAALLTALATAGTLLEADFAGVDDGWTAFAAARDAAIALANDVEATQTAVDGANEALLAAIGAIEAATPVLLSIEASAPVLSLPVGRSVPIFAKAIYDRFVPVGQSTFTFTSSDENVLTVDEAGIVTGVAAGAASVDVKNDANPKLMQTLNFTVHGYESGEITLASSQNGEVIADREGPYYVTQKVKLTAKPDAGYLFDCFAVDGRRETANPLTVTIGVQKNVTAHFVRKSDTGAATGSSDKTTTTESNADGSTSTIVTDKKTGTVVETAKYPDGSKVVTTTTKEGESSSIVTVPAGKEKVTVTIATAEKPAVGTVAAIVKADGTREVVKTSVATAEGMRVTLTEGASIELIDNTKTFTDVASGDWHRDAVTFATSRELFNGTSTKSFSPNAPMTRAMLMTVLYRYEGASVKDAGDSWYAAPMAWAKEAELSDGTNPEGNITREQLATMLYRYAKPAEAVKADASKFTDGGKVSDFAAEAMNWAIGTGLMGGKGNNLLDPQGNATRAEVATMLMRFCETIKK